MNILVSILSCLVLAIANAQSESETNITITPKGMALVGRFDASYFFLTDSLYTWDQAFKLCRREGAELASVETESKNEMVYGFLTSQKASSVWTSGNDLLVTGRFIWANTRSLFNYTHWIGGFQPYIPDCHCVSITSQTYNCHNNCVGNYAWVEEDCSLLKRALCEWSP